MPPCRVERATLLGVMQQQIVVVQCPLLQGLPVQISLLISTVWMMAVKVSNRDCRMRKDWCSSVPVFSWLQCNRSTVNSEQNQLPAVVIEQESPAAFKNQLDRLAPVPRRICRNAPAQPPPIGVILRGGLPSRQDKSTKVRVDKKPSWCWDSQPSVGILGIFFNFRQQHSNMVRREPA